jgi:hypothetical protein
MHLAHHQPPIHLARSPDGLASFPLVATTVHLIFELTMHTSEYDLQEGGRAQLGEGKYLI